MRLLKHRRRGMEKKKAEEKKAERPVIHTTLGVTGQAHEALQQLAEMVWPAAVSYHISKLTHLVKKEAREFERQRYALIKKIGVSRDATQAELERGTETTIWEVPGTKMPEFIAAMQTVQEVEVTIPWGPVTVDMLDKSPGGIRASIIHNLMPDFLVGMPDEPPVPGPVYGPQQTSKS
jgi:hypothetical protein